MNPTNSLSSTISRSFLYIIILAVFGIALLAREPQNPVSPNHTSEISTSSATPDFTNPRKRLNQKSKKL